MLRSTSNLLPVCGLRRSNGGTRRMDRCRSRAAVTSRSHRFSIHQSAGRYIESAGRNGMSLHEDW
jgi:hypothetical protein